MKKSICLRLFWRYLAFFAIVLSASSQTVFKGVDINDPSNAVKAINQDTVLSGFLQELFMLSFSKDEKERRFGGANISDIAAGSLSYAKEFRLDEDSWNSIVDAFLLEGYLSESNLDFKKGYGILLLQRPTKLGTLSREALKISPLKSQK